MSYAYYACHSSSVLLTQHIKSVLLTDGVRVTALEADDEETVDIQEEGVIYNPRKKKGGMPVIKAATMQKLVERLTHPSESGEYKYFSEMYGLTNG